MRKFLLVLPAILVILSGCSLSQGDIVPNTSENLAQDLSSDPDEIITQKDLVLKLGEKINVFDTSITPQEVLADSRCPSNAQCIWAGELRLQAMIGGGPEAISQVFLIGKEVVTKKVNITLIEVSPYPMVDQTIKPNDYQFTFRVQKR